MDNNESKFEDYFSGRMSDIDVENFNIELNSNEIFKQDYEYFLSVKESSSLIERDKLRVQLNTVEIENTSPSNENNTSNPNALFSSMKWILGIAALSLASYCIYKSFTPAEPAVMYAQNFEVYQAQTARGGSAEDIVNLYRNGEYNEFIEKVRNTDSSPELFMMLANAYLETNNFIPAEETLLNISDESSLRDLKYWNLGLVNLKLENIEQAKLYFSQLQNLSNFKKAEIEKILSEITK